MRLSSDVIPQKVMAPSEKKQFLIFDRFLKFLDFLEGYPAKSNSEKFNSNYFIREPTKVLGEAQFFKLTFSFCISTKDSKIIKHVFPALAGL